LKHKTVFEPPAKHSKKVEKIRKITTQLARNLGIQIAPLEALQLRLPDFIPDEQLQAWATMQPRNNMDRSIKTKANSLIEKMQEDKKIKDPKYT
jgi:hypothetical protein